MPGSPTVPLPKKPASPGGPAGGSPKLVVVALLVAVAAVVLVNLYVVGVRAGAQEGEFAFFRLRVAKDVGQVLSMDDVELQRLPVRYRDALPDVVEPNAAGEPLRLGDPFTRSAELGEPLTTRMFDDLTADAARRLITEGMRGVSLPVVSKLLPDPLKAEMRVDLLAPVRASGGRREMMVVMENVRVVSVGALNIVDERAAGTNRTSGNFDSLTVEARPDEAVLLNEITQEVQKIGTYTVLLRSPEERGATFIPDGGINPRLLERLGLAVAEQARGR
ncbi:MAG: hypothetical protein AAF800_01250 [Planctomycetota bacterium]